MRNIALTQIVRSDQNVSAEHFGGNVVFSRNTDNGTPDSENQLAHRELDISVARYPAGEPDVAYIDGLLIDGALPQHLVNYLEAAQENGQRVVIVTPTHAAYSGADDLIPFTRLLMEGYHDVVHAFEIGNEYWNHQTETSYGQVANDSVLAISAGLSAAQIDVPIWVQMGDAGGPASEFRHSEDLGWLWRNIEANNSIIDQLSPEARAEIDGLVEHYYFREQGQFLNGELNDQNIRLDRAIWESALEHDVTLNITEWNIRTTNLEQLGVKAASSLIAQFSFMMELEVDEAYIWPPMHNTSSDLAGGDVVILDGETGIVVNSVGGATYDLMSSSLVGLEYLPSVTTQASGFVEQYVYGDADTVVVYLTSRSNDTEVISFSVDQIWDNATLRSATQVGYDQSTSDGKHYDYTLDRFVDSTSILVNGAEYYIDEHDVQATIEVHDISGTKSGEDYTVTLLPYEVIELVYDLPPQPETPEMPALSPDYAALMGAIPTSPDQLRQPTITHIIGDNAIVGNQNSNTIITYNASNQILGGNGNDVIRSGAGNDSVEGNNGNDSIDAGSGFDLILGGLGFDTIHGGDGVDTIDGGDSADSLSGGQGNDVIMGGNGFDQIHGDNGADSLWGGASPDRIYGGAHNDWISAGSNFGYTTDGVWGGSGNDTIFGDAGFDYLDGGIGNDLIDGGHQADNLFGRGGMDTLLGGAGLDRLFGGGDNDQLFGGDGNDGHFGEAGNDTLWGGSGNDRFFGGHGNDISDGGADNDTIYAGAGFDTLIGNTGDDLLFGNFNADVFVFGEEHGNDTIADFQVESAFEKIDLSGLGSVQDFQDILSHSTQVGQNTSISTGVESNITLLNVQISELSAADFLFSSS